jgi:formylglycine-generating enzyme required for sulfatase activity
LREAFFHAFNGVEMALVPTGCFNIGISTSGEVLARRMGAEDWVEGERPTTEICFKYPFWIDRYEVSNQQFTQLDGFTANVSSQNDPLLPRDNITWFEARAFCESRGGDLPTEAQWEYASRGPDNLIFPWGNTFISSNLNYCDAQCEFPHRDSSGSDGYGQASPVGAYASGMSWVGAYNMVGNVYEWTSSIRTSYPYDEGDGRETRDNLNSERVYRGGSWSDGDDAVLRASARFQAKPIFKNTNVGFRCVRNFYPSDLEQ